MPQGVTVDTPLYALYRLYDYFVVDHVTGYRNQLEYFWKQRTWAVSKVPDPRDDDAARYAFLSCVPALIVRAFSARIKLGLAGDTPAIISPEQAKELRSRPESSKMYESVLTWTKTVPPLLEPLFIRSHDDVVMDGLDDPRVDRDFKTKNILFVGSTYSFHLKAPASIYTFVNQYT